MNKEKLDLIFSKHFKGAVERDRHIESILEYAPRFEINTPERMSAFLAQIGHECAGFKTFVESLNYSVDGLLKTFSRARISEADARKYGRTGTQRANQEALANILYGGEWGRTNLGNTQPGDGWKFRGRGPKQITGRHNHTRLRDKMGIDVVSNPDLLLEVENGIIAALYYWDSVNPTEKSLNTLADSGNDVLLTRRINGGRLGLKERTELRLAILEDLE